VPFLVLLAVSAAHAQSAQIFARFVTIRARRYPECPRRREATWSPSPEAATDANGGFEFEYLDPGRYHVTFTLINFATTRRAVAVRADETARVDTVLQLAVNADVTVTAKRTFTSVADVDGRSTVRCRGMLEHESDGALTQFRGVLARFPSSL